MRCLHMWTFAYVHISQFWFLLTPTVLNRHLCAAQLFRLFRRLWNVRSSAHVHVTDDVWSTAHVWSSAHVTVWSSRISLNDLPPPRFRSFWITTSPWKIWWMTCYVTSCYETLWRSDKNGPVLCSNAGTVIFCGVTQECAYFGVPYGALISSNEFK